MKAYRDKDGDLWCEISPGKAILVDEELLNHELALPAPAGGHVVPQDVDDINSKYGPIKEV